MDWRKQRIDNVALMKSGLFEWPAKGCLNQEIAYQYHNPMLRQTNDDHAFLGASSSHGSFLPICRPTAGCGMSLGSDDPNLPYSGFNYLMTSNSGSSMPGLNEYNLQQFQKPSQDDNRAFSVLVDSKGKAEQLLEDYNQLYGEVVSPEQISSVTTCSDAECNSDKTPFKVGAFGVLSKLTSGDNMEVDKMNALLPETTISSWVQEDSRALSSMPFSMSNLRYEYLHELQALKSEDCHLQSCPPAHVEISLGARMHGYRVEHTKLHCERPVERSSKLSQLSSDILLSVEQKAPRQTDSTLSLLDILVSYVSFQSKLVGSGKQQQFLSHTHYTRCIKICECEKYRTLISHFDDCQIVSCNLCQPVRQWYTKKNGSWPIFEPSPIKNFASESGMPKRCVSRDLHARDCIVSDMEPSPKRMKMENATKFDDWSLLSIIRPHLEQREGGLVYNEDSTNKTNKELTSSKEASSTAVTWNATASNGGSLWSRKSNELLNVGQAPEGHLNSASLDEVPRSTGNLGNSLHTFNDALDPENTKLGKDGAISRYEEYRLIVEQQDMGCIQARNVKGDVTFGCQSSHSGGNYVLPQVGNLGNSLQTFSEALDLDNVKLGNGVSTSHSEQQNMLDEQQEIVDCVKTSKVKNDVTFGFQDLSSADIPVLPQVGDIGKSLETFNDTLDLDSINLGKDDAISHSGENNLVDEKQDCVKNSVNSDVTFSSQSLNSDGNYVLPQHAPVNEVEDFKLMSQSEKENIDAKFVLPNPDNKCGRNLEDLKESGVSLTDFFTAEQIREHLYSLNPDINLELRASMSANTLGSNTCQLCDLDSLAFTQLTMCCTSCGARIKHKLTYYWTKDGKGAQYRFCTICFKAARGGNILHKGLSFPKAELYKGKNTEESGEPWVQCDRCERWQHQICALYNSERDLKGKAKYTCPFCRLAEIESKGHLSITPVCGAQDLPRTKLSDYIEQRLLGSLQHERKQRAEFLQKNPEEVPGASDLTVRVVLADYKQLRVKQQFLDILHGEAYPTEFPYKSKVILLFQKVCGVDVCIFAMYVQEYGSECGNPNKRSVYISYIDSVKYFRPDIKTVAGVALRTFVYHEILIGYLDYCKRLGFVTCYIWACPPLKGEDYILHCHPETQKRPNSQKLVQWYKKMLKKGKEDNVVVEFTNFYDHFFVPNNDSNCKITAARLPYFDGDYWSRAIEDMALTIEKDGGESDRQLKNQMTKRTMKAMGHNDLSADATKDIRVMHKLGHKILAVKEEFLVVHLQFTCTKCNDAILSGSCWSCNQCSKFHLCGRCLYSNLRESHDVMFGDKHQICEIPVNEVAADTDDKDGRLDNDFFDDRLSFLNFCEKNFYRFDTLRRAKHSSMMILHHLHASRARAMETICSICKQHVVVGWHCQTCSDFHVCNACYQREGDHCHAHKLVKHLKGADSRERSDQMQQQQIASETDSRKESEQIQQHRDSHSGGKKVRMLLDLLEHANECTARGNLCSYPHCLSIKNAFRHATVCERRAPGGCFRCKKTWNMLKIHSQVCKNPDCHIPRCKDIKKFTRKRTTACDVEERGGVDNLNNR